MSRSLLLIPSLLSAALLHAQAATTELTTVNDRFAGTVQVKIDRHQRMVFDFFDASTRFRQDVVPVGQLDPEQVHYSVEEDAIILVCKSDAPQCLTKEIFKMNTIRSSGRSNLPRPANDPDAVSTMQELRALILKTQEQESTLSETQRTTQRRN